MFKVCGYSIISSFKIQICILSFGVQCTFLVHPTLNNIYSKFRNSYCICKLIHTIDSCIARIKKKLVTIIYSNVNQNKSR